jgi:glycosyltransferase involved in cell wall biosynthesis
VNILIVSREFPPSKRTGGIGSYSRDLAFHLSSRGHKVVVLAASDNILKSSYQKIDNYELYRISGGDFYVNKSFFGRIINLIRHQLLHNYYRKKINKNIISLNKIYSFDIIEIPDFDNEGKYWLQNKFVPTVIRFHSPTSMDRYNNTLAVRTKRQINEISSFYLADGHSFVSLALKNLITNSLDKTFDGIKSKVIHNSVNIPKNILVNKRNINKPYVIMGAGTLSKSKGFNRLINACSILNNEGFNINLQLYGRISNDIKNYVLSKEATNNWLTIHGQINRNELFENYFNADLCCFPSRFEPMGLTALEAMGMGGLVLAGSHGGWSEIITESENGFLFDPSLEDEILVQKIKFILLLDNETKKRIRGKAKRTIFESNSMETFTEKTLSFYKSIINN